MTKRWLGDVIVLGGGPAGSALATLLARRGHRVLLAAQPPGIRWRPAEIVAPHTRRLLRQQKLSDPFDLESTALCSGVEGLWSGAVDFFDYELMACEPGLAISRNAFDSELVRHAVIAGAEVQSGKTVNAYQKLDGAWTLRLSGPSGELVSEAPLLVDAVGRSAHSVGLRSQRTYYDRLVALVCRLPTGSCSKADLLLEATANGWWYVTRAADGEAAAAFLTDADLLQESGLPRDEVFRTEFAETRIVQHRLPPLPPELRLFGCDARTGKRDRIAVQGRIAIGDAAYSVDPLSGAGIQRCVETAACAAAECDSFLAGDEKALERYSVWANKDFNRWLTYRNEVYAAADIDGPVGAFWRRRNAVGFAGDRLRGK
ncbi:FAD-dependent monooxygenase [Pseudomonas brenneri]|uniref:NAD(P)/FAD-dependent oxidoreductase n=1 Tax=Pseudomonas brenneri TaxID=129817 RepID=UPI0025A2FB6F|nr:FAD-dependent monooxygenase [Pseudomonas brenneri]WJM91543.1 FAD-dependent monooxygenase [Pseudomonas brenneri]